jgi:hypothetical protein
VFSSFVGQIAAFCMSAVAGAVMFFLWWRLDGEGRRQIWRFYGWFCGLTMCGSCFGAVAWGSSLHSEVNVETARSMVSTPSENQRFPLFATWQHFRAVSGVTYAIDFMFLTVAKLMVLERMTDFAKSHKGGLKRRWVWGKRVVVAAVVVMNVTGLCGNVAAAVYQVQTGHYWSEASAALANNDTLAFNEYRNLARAGNEFASSISSVQMFCEVAVLHLIVVTFAVVGVACARVVRTVLLNTEITDENAASARKIRLQVVGPVAVVFVSFLLRSVFATMNALGFSLQNRANLISCSAPLSPSIWCEATCFNEYTQMSEWMDRTPEFELTMMLISSPLALLVTLWGMTSDRALQLMRHRARDNGTMQSLKNVLSDGQSSLQRRL